VVLEVIASTIEDGVEAQSGGADRLEVVRDLDRGGLSPDVALVEGLLARVTLPLRVMVRAEEPFVPTSEDVVSRMCAEARVLARLPIDGIVFGALAADHSIDLEVLRRLAEASAPRAITFHRAFELAPDPVAALGALSTVAQVDRVLTSAGEGAAEDRVGRLRAWRDGAPSTPALLFAAGLDAAAIAAAAEAGFEVHVGRAARVGHRTEGAVSAALVAGVRAFTTLQTP
jgi:copper homeostasis protein